MSDQRPSPSGFLARWLQRHAAAAGGIDTVGLAEILLAVAVALAIIVAAFWITLRFVRPAPPDEFVISTGGEGGAYQIYARRYGELLERHRVRVIARPSTGSPENVARLADPGSGVSVALVQGGVGAAEAQPGLVTLAVLYYEPLWVFYRGERDLTLLTELAGMRIAIGPEGSGTRALVHSLLDALKLRRVPERLLPLGGIEAAEALKAGTVDAAMFVAGADASYVKDLLSETGIRLMNFSHAEALSRRLPYLAAVTVPRGVIDLGGDIPPRDITLVATTAYLVAREDFHPALVALLLDAVARVHGGGGVFHRAGEFPAARDGDYPLSEDARRYFKSGPPFFQRYLPFWLANLAQRLLVLLVPLIAVAIPVIRLFPLAFNYRMRRRVFRWYRDLRAIEDEASREPSSERMRELLARLDAVDEGVGRTRLPLAFKGQAYDLKLHVNLVRARLQRWDRSGGNGPLPELPRGLPVPPAPPTSLSGTLGEQ